MKLTQKSYRASQLLLVGVSGFALNLCLTSGAAQAQVTRAKAWVWADRPTTTTTYTPALAYQYNSTGATNQATRLGVGQYRINFPGLATTGGTVHVSSYGGNHHCKVVNWGSSGTAQQVRVNCFTPNGAAVDGRFNVLFYKEASPSPNRTAAYLWANQPTTASYTPNTIYQWNSKGATNTVNRLGVGRYRAILPSLNVVGGTVLVTAYGSGSESCKVVGWSSSGSNTSVNVNCFNSSGSPVDTTYNLSYMTDVVVGLEVSLGPHYGGYIWANNATASSYTPLITYRFNNTGGGHSITRTAAGTYTVRFAYLKPSNRTIAQVTAYGTTGEYCTVNSWDSDGGSGTRVYIKCFNNSGSPVDQLFTLTYLTDQRVGTTIVRISEPTAIAGLLLFGMGLLWRRKKRILLNQG
ncbi:PEP-CTERM sorting domain-containing protein [Nostoc parmelioides]|uniref:PEP-CTERM sorting domain-containing protein n=1 Tax=Nostoc parmelioides FACHB-3921 TaxID=2692909 RepID=A0ABR8BFS6_9NOSO|nr:PEP-CTERM sorting domain-containing protein [Nostoc parmelioides]MBD2252374.1 PEP-CTERM sorting domain-containing protein [Nostoc parmelioides FACHB-3921]